MKMLSVKWDHTRAAVCLGLLATVLFTLLLIFHKISGAEFVVLMPIVMLFSLAVAAFSRISEIDLTKGRLVMAEVKEVIEEAKAIAETTTIPPANTQRPELQLAREVGDVYDHFDAVKEDPVSEISRAWDRLEHAAEATVHRLGITVQYPRAYGAALGQAGVFIPTMQRLYHALSQWRRNAEAGQAGEMTSPFHAAQFVAIADVFTRYLDNLKELPAKQAGAS